MANSPGQFQGDMPRYLDWKVKASASSSLPKILYITSNSERPSAMCGAAESSCHESSV